MTQKDKELLLKDLCARLLYGVKVTWDGKHSLIVTPHIYCAIISEDNINNLPKLLLRPMSSMTEEEFVEYHLIKYNKVTYRDKWERIDVGKYHNVGIIPIDEYLDWLNKHHFDYRGLIEKGLALEAPEGMYNLDDYIQLDPR